MVGLESYLNPQKETWRGWQWNQAVAHQPEFIGRKHAPTKGSFDERSVMGRKNGLYLCGPTAADFPVAISHGIRPENLIAIDIQEKNIAAIREAGGIGICDDVCEVLRAWPEDWPIDIIVADFCCGFDATSIRFINSILCSAAVGRGTVISINLQRGRDSSTNSWRSVLSGYAKQGMEKHRGYQWLCSLYAAFASISDDNLTDAEWNEVVASESKPVFSTYTGSRVKMDSAVFKWIADPFKGSREPVSNPKLSAGVDAARRRVTAARAVRTAKLRRN